VEKGLTSGGGSRVTAIAIYASERALRALVVQRKIMGTLRMEGTSAYTRFIYFFWFFLS
jgi:hypothetical protein